MMAEAERTVLIVGSANVDVSVSAPRLPQAGETVMGDISLVSVGGKGANQAVAAARCGARAQFVGRVGDDAFGQMVLDSLGDARVGTRDMTVAAGLPTGLATITVDAAGQNCIVVVPGANAALTPADIDALVPGLRDVALVVLQLEIPLPTVYHCIELAATAGIPVILNPAPYRPLDLSRLGAGVTYLVPNETEAAQLDGRGALQGDAEILAATRRLRDSGIDCVITTLGARGCVVVDDQPPRWIDAMKVDAVDATGAGDAFVGCLAASLAHGYARDEAVRRAVRYASLTTTRRGAQVSYPVFSEADRGR
jgi:ribokinase